MIINIIALWFASRPNMTRDIYCYNLFHDRVLDIAFQSYWCRYSYRGFLKRLLHSKTHPSDFPFLVTYWQDLELERAYINISCKRARDEFLLRVSEEIAEHWFKSKVAILPRVSEKIVKLCSVRELLWNSTREGERGLSRALLCPSARRKLLPRDEALNETIKEYRPMPRIFPHF